MIGEKQHYKELIKEILKEIHDEVIQKNQWCQKAEEITKDYLTNIIHLVYRDKPYEGHYKDYEFSTSNDERTLV